jgi:hypothetical protein
MEDRHGEMTGAITVNMIFCAPLVTLWAIYIGPWLLDDNITLVVVIGAAMAVVLPLVFYRASRRMWAWFSEWADRV